MAAASRRKKATRYGGGSSAIGWFLTGTVMGAGLAAFLFIKGYFPDAREQQAAAQRPAIGSEPELIKTEPAIEETEKPRYDFFTVLPEMEVVVPDRELSSRAQPAAPEAGAASSNEQFILQAGSFRSASDAEELKARLALLGSVANIEVVKVNDATWHRVRIGPLGNAREADALRRSLQDNGIEVLVLKGSS